MYQRILVPIDGSATASRGLKEAVALARTCRASLVLLHVVEYAPVLLEMATSATWELVARDLQTQGQDVVDAARRDAMAAGIACEGHVVDAAALRVCDVVVEQARQHRCDLVVMGTHGRRGVAHALIGSDAERVIRLSPVPVLLVRADAA
jgi:nucleotide-binding universal stress UspA family protein